MSQIDEHNEHGIPLDPAHDTPDGMPRPGAMDRRRFLGIMGASFALASAAGCRFTREGIRPFAGRPMDMTPGDPQYYATCMDFAGVAAGLLATSFDGRPIKLDGNPLAAGGHTGSSVYQQAAILEMYDPDRSRFVTHKTYGHEAGATWDDFIAFAGPHFARLRARGGLGLRVLAESSSSPSVADMRDRFLAAYPEAAWHEYEAVSRDNERAGAALAFGTPLRTQLRLSKANVIVSLDSDVLGRHPAWVQYALDFANGRTADDGLMNRLHVVENNITITGAMADHRLPLPASRIPQFALWLAAELFLNLSVPLPSPFAGDASLLRPFIGDSRPSASLRRVARDLADSRGAGVIVCGPGQPPEVHALAHVMNVALGNVGKTIFFTQEPDPNRASHVDSVRSLAGEMRDGKVSTLLIFGGNPVHDGPADIRFRKALTSVRTSIRLGLYNDETSHACSWHLPRSHFLESWGDGRAHNGTLVTAQPLIAPLYDGRTVIEVLSLLTDKSPMAGQDIVRRTLELSSSESSWRKLIHDGVIAKSAWIETSPSLIGGGWFRTMATSIHPSRALKTFEIVFTPDYTIYDGRFANVGWIQELPDPITKLTWDNAALISPATAKEYSLSREDVIRIDVRGKSIEIAVYVLPGHADRSITLPLGYGRDIGAVTKGAGVDVYPLRTSDAMHIVTGARITKTGRTYRLAVVQDRFDVKNTGRKAMAARVPELIREGTLGEVRNNPKFAKRTPEFPQKSLYEERKYLGHRWGMTIDLTRCIGCAACTTACQAENNIPIVGKDQVWRGREMHWIRVDRYIDEEKRNPSVVFQPVPCMQCENAPCEQVCPVAATIHNREGLNDMVYNRCIGMRFCSQNCPFKVRRFNWFNNHKHITDVEKMPMNPDVTVRSRGVMEKCTYCVQRIEEARIRARSERRAIRDGEIVPACVQACPTRAIAFGDLNLPGAAIKKTHEGPRAYSILDVLYVKPRTLYLARLRNPASET